MHWRAEWGLVGPRCPAENVLKFGSESAICSPNHAGILAQFSQSSFFFPPKMAEHLKFFFKTVKSDLIKIFSFFFIFLNIEIILVHVSSLFKSVLEAPIYT